MKKPLVLLVIIGTALIGLILGYPRVSEYIFKQQELKSFNGNGGAEITIQVDMTNISPNKRNMIFDKSRDILFRRIRLLGFYPFIQDSSDYKIIVKLARVGDLDLLVNLIGTTAQLSFWEEGDKTGTSSSAQMATPSALPASIDTLFHNPNKSNLSGGDLQLASVAYDQNTGKSQVNLSFTSDGTAKFADITKRNVGRIVAIVLDNQIISTPTVNEAILTGDAVITGDFTNEQAESLSIQLNAGALPTSITVLEKHYVKAKNN